MTPKQEQEIKMTASIGKVASQIAELSLHTGISVKELLNENSLIVALAEKEIREFTPQN